MLVAGRGGTTHPAATLRLLTHGRLTESGACNPPTPAQNLSSSPDGHLALPDRSDRGIEKYYYATDNLRADVLKGLTPADLTLISAEAGLDFDHATQTGAVFHLMGTLSMLGKVGVTCIADSLEAARSMYKRLEAAVLGAQEAAASAELRRRLTAFLDDVPIGSPGPEGATSHRSFDATAIVEFAVGAGLFTASPEDIYAQYVESKSKAAEDALSQGEK